MIQQELITKQIPGISEDEIAAHFNLLPDRYFLHTEAGEIALHIQMVNRLLKSINEADSVSSLRPIIDWKDDLNRVSTVVNVVTWDRAGLFYKLAGAFSVAGLNILGAKVISRTDHIAIDTFYVVEPGRGVVQNQRRDGHFCARPSKPRSSHNKDLYPDIVAQAKKIAHPPSTRRRPTPCTPRFRPPSRSTMNCRCSARSSRSRRATRSACSTAWPRPFPTTASTSPSPAIGTERGVAIDTFYIESANHEPVEDTGRLHALRDALAKVIKPAAASPASSAG